jgi:2-dehydropantoate 2-reductase
MIQSQRVSFIFTRGGKNTWTGTTTYIQLGGGARFSAKRYSTSRTKFTESSYGDEARRIHVLGTGNIGAIVAHALAGLPKPVRPRITLLLHRKSLLSAWRQRGETLDVLRYEDGASQPRGGIDVELVAPETLCDSNGHSAERSSSPSSDVGIEHAQGPIHHLIVSVKAAQTVSALSPIKHRLGQTSTILFLQNGMGSPEEAAEKLFPEQHTRPRFMQGIVLPGGWMVEPFVVRHAGRGNIPVGTIPHLQGNEKNENGNESSRYLIGTLAQAPAVAAQEVEYTELIQRQLEKLTINVVANPLTAILNEDNRVLVQPQMLPLIRSLVAETAMIIRSLPELQAVPGVQERFAAQRLEDRVMSYLRGVVGNISSMCQDMRAGKKTEIEYINGYMVKRAKEIGVPCEINAMLLQMVLTKEAVVKEKKG